jgi:hypothetical protein
MAQAHQARCNGPMSPVHGPGQWAWVGRVMRELTLHSIVKSKNKNLPGEDGFELSRASPGGMDLICLTPPHYTLVRPPPGSFGGPFVILKKIRSWTCSTCILQLL